MHGKAPGSFLSTIAIGSPRKARMNLKMYQQGINLEETFPP